MILGLDFRERCSLGKIVPLEIQIRLEWYNLHVWYMGSWPWFRASSRRLDGRYFVKACSDEEEERRHGFSCQITGSGRALPNFERVCRVSADLTNLIVSTPCVQSEGGEFRVLDLKVGVLATDRDLPLSTNKWFSFWYLSARIRSRRVLHGFAM